MTEQGREQALMTDDEWKQLLRLLQRYGDTELDQHDHFKVPLRGGARMYVRFTVVPLEAYGERDEHFPLVDPETGRRVEEQP